VLAEPAAKDGAAAKENSTENAMNLVRKFDLIFLPAKICQQTQPIIHSWYQFIQSKCAWLADVRKNL